MICFLLLEWQLYGSYNVAHHRITYGKKKFKIENTVGITLGESLRRLMPLLRGIVCSHLNSVYRENLSGEHAYREDSLKGSEYKIIQKYYIINPKIKKISMIEKLTDSKTEHTQVAKIPSKVPKFPNLEASDDGGNVSWHS